LFIGDTGSGKTTSIKALLGYKMGLRLFNGIKYITIVEPVDNPKVKKMESNPQCRSVSRYVIAVRPKESMTNKEIYLMDTPGFVDTGGVEVQIANGLAISKALKSCRSVVPVIVISQESWGPRGEGFRNLARTLSIIFRDYSQCKGSVVAMLNRFSKDEIKEMPKKLRNLLDTMQSSDSVDTNYVTFLEHLQELADKG
jgi:hypothetical protein